MRPPPKTDPYCEFKDDHERRSALNVREYCRVACRCLTVLGMIAAAKFAAPAGGVAALLQLLR